VSACGSCYSVRQVVGPRVDAPRSNREAEELDRKRRLLTAAHVAPLHEYVQGLRLERGGDRVPDFDPTEAGINAPILLLLEAPGGKATRERGGSGFVSPDNDDGSAENMWKLLGEAGIDRARDVVTWNIVPWYIGSDHKIRRAEPRDLDEARPYVEELLGLLPDLRVVVLIGRRAAQGWRHLHITGPQTVEVPHPSPQNLNTRRGSRGRLLEGLRRALRLASV
jgi:uracil-DNA glycosylase